MDPLETLRGTPGDPFKPNASAFGLLADVAQSFRQGKLGSPGQKPGFVPPESQIVAKVKNLQLSHTYAVGDWAAVSHLPPSGSHTTPYPSDWRAGGRFHEINDEPLLATGGLYSQSPCYAIFLEPCPPGFVARACVGGLAYTRVRLPVPGALADVGVPAYANALAPDGTYPADPWGQLYGRLTRGPFRILQYFTEDVITLGDYEAVHALVEVNSPDVLPPPVPPNAPFPPYVTYYSATVYPRGRAYGVFEVGLELSMFVPFTSWSATVFLRDTVTLAVVATKSFSGVCDPATTITTYRCSLPFDVTNVTDDFKVYAVDATFSPNGGIQHVGGWYLSTD